jgi:hypothetical protein
MAAEAGSMSHTPGSEEADPYAVRYVAFVDILGFAALVQSADASPERRRDIIAALKTIREAHYEQADVRTHSFSDSLILSAARTPYGLWGLVTSLDALAWNLLQIGVLARGAITVGGIYQDDEIVFGTGVNEAYRLESNVAQYPRIMLGKHAVEDADRYASDENDRAILLWKRGRTHRLIRDADGVVFIHFLGELFSFLGLGQGNRAERHEYREMGLRAQGIIQAKLDDTVDDPRVYEKVRWLGRYWNGTLRAATITVSEMPLSAIVLAGRERAAPTLPHRTSL